MNDDQILNFEFSVKETNLLLTALGERPFKEVAELISKVHTKANEQLNTQEGIISAIQDAAPKKEVNN